MRCSVTKFVETYAVALLLALTLTTFGQGRPSGASPVFSFNTGGAEPDKILNPGDMVEMRVWREDDMTTRARIMADGSVSLPLLGDVRIGGMTIKSARTLIANLYDRDYLVRPQVFLTHTASTNSSTFLILGQVHAPGLIAIPKGKREIDMLDGIGLAGGFTRLAKQSKVLIKRKEGSVERVYEVNAERLAKDTAGKPFMLKHGDKVTVQERIF